MMRIVLASFSIHNIGSSYIPNGMIVDRVSPGCSSHSLGLSTSRASDGARDLALVIDPGCLLNLTDRW